MLLSLVREGGRPASGMGQIGRLGQAVEHLLQA